MIWVYRALFLPLLLIATPYYLWRMRRRGGYLEKFGHRFGSTDQLPAKKTGVQRIWLQAVSVGEMLALAPLLQSLQHAGHTEVYLTTTTSTGYKLAKEKYAALTIGIGYFPLDFWAFAARAWRRIQPDLCILMEGERWPEHVHQATARGVAVLSINARLSDRSFRRALRFKAFLQPFSHGLTQVLCASRQDEQRFQALGFSPERLQTTGNLKLDVAIPLMGENERAALRRELGLGAGLILLGSSTWSGEEVALLAALRSARERGLVVSLLLVPRHAERRAELRSWLESSGLTYHFRSSGSYRDPVVGGRELTSVAVVVGDTTGELRQFTQLADLVFVGKSLAPHEGGQTPVEAAVLGKPILHGPHMTNFREIIRTLTEAKAVRRVADPDELITAVVSLLEDAPQREKLAAAARAWHAENCGATERTLLVIHAHLAASAK